MPPKFTRIILHFKLSIWERIALRRQLYGEVRTYKQRAKKIIIKLLSVFFDFGSLYKRSVLKQIANDKCLAWISGINLFQKNKLYYVPIGSKNIFMYNGLMDHCFYEVTDETYYYPGKQFTGKSDNFLLEAFHLDPAHKQLDYGFMWYHMRGCKKNNKSSMVGVHGIDLRLLASYTYREMKKRGWFVIPGGLKRFEPYFAFLHDFDRKDDLPTKPVY